MFHVLPTWNVVLLQYNTTQIGRTWNIKETRQNKEMFLYFYNSRKVFLAPCFYAACRKHKHSCSIYSLHFIPIFTIVWNVTSICISHTVATAASLEVATVQYKWVGVLWCASVTFGNWTSFVSTCGRSACDASAKRLQTSRNRPAEPRKRARFKVHYIYHFASHTPAVVCCVRALAVERRVLWSWCKRERLRKKGCGALPCAWIHLCMLHIFAKSTDAFTGEIKKKHHVPIISRKCLVFV